MTAGASAGKNQVRPASQGSVRMSECDFQSQLRAPLKAVGTYHYVHLDGAPPLARPRSAAATRPQSRKGATRDPKGVSTHGRSHRRLHITGGEPPQL